MARTLRMRRTMACVSQWGARRIGQGAPVVVGRATFLPIHPTSSGRGDNDSDGMWETASDTVMAASQEPLAVSVGQYGGAASSLAGLAFRPEQ